MLLVLIAVLASLSAAVSFMTPQTSALKSPKSECSSENGVGPIRYTTLVCVTVSPCSGGGKRQHVFPSHLNFGKLWF